MDADNGAVFWLLETLMKPVSADLWGNTMSWLHLPIGQQLIAQTVHPAELSWRLPMLLSTAELWQSERTHALRRFRSKGERAKKPH